MRLRLYLPPKNLAWPSKNHLKDVCTIVHSPPNSIHTKVYLSLFAFFRVMKRHLGNLGMAAQKT